MRSPSRPRPGAAQAVASIDEAALTLEPLSAEAKQLHDEHVLLAWIAEERAKLPVDQATDTTPPPPTQRHP